MRIGISGAQSVGKTTLLNALRSESIFKDYAICDEVTRRVMSYGFPINEHAIDMTQRLIMQEHVMNVFMHDNMITDRTALDGLVYTQYLMENNKGMSEKTWTFANNVYHRVMPHYDVLFYIEPEFELVGDGVRSENKFFRDRIVTIFASKLETTLPCPVIRLHGSVRERTERVVEATQNYLRKD